MRFVFVTDELPRPGTAGHLALNHEIINWLQGQGCSVTILLTGARIGWPASYHAYTPVFGPDIFRIGPVILARTFRAQAHGIGKALIRLLPKNLARAVRRRKASGADAVLGAFTSPAVQAWCARFIAAEPPDAVLIDTIFRAPLLAKPELCGINSLIIAHDVFFRRHRALISAGYKTHPAVLSYEMEARLLNLAHSVAAIQPREAQDIRQMCPDKKILTVPMPARPCPPPPNHRRLAGRLVFVGSASLPNVDGLRWFLETNWAELRQWFPSLELDLVGDCGGALAKLPKGVNRLGRVPNLAPILHKASLAIAPLRVGSGLKIKMLDYARHGLFTVATPASLAGFAADEAAPFIAASSAAEFTAAIVERLADDPADDQIALAYITRHYGVEASFSGIGKVMNLVPLV